MQFNGFRAGCRYELPALPAAPLNNFRNRCGTSVGLHTDKLVPLHDVFVIPIHLDLTTRDAQSLSTGYQASILQHHATAGKLRRERTHNYFSRWKCDMREYTSAGHKRANEAVTVTHLGSLEESPVSIQAPGDARSLSYGRAVCTFSFDTIRSTTLTQETVTATPLLLHHSEISHPGRIIFVQLTAGRVFQYKYFRGGLNSPTRE